MSKKKQEKYHVILIGMGGEDEPRVLKPSINGKEYWIMRGELVPVPEEVRHDLDNATRPVYEKQENGTMEYVGERHRYPFSVMYRDIPKAAYIKLREIATQKGAHLTEPMIDEILDAVNEPQKKAANG